MRDFDRARQKNPSIQTTRAAAIRCGFPRATGHGLEYITVFPQLDSVVLHKVDIDASYAANMPVRAWNAALDMLLDARCDSCKLMP